MQIISNPTHDEIKKAAKTLKNGHLVAFPTETVYGLGADAENSEAVGRIYSVKARPTNHPLIVHISSVKRMKDWATDIPDYAFELAKNFWPGPMTLILPRKRIAKNFITGGQNSVGLRVPDNDIALALLREFEKIDGRGIAAPSANRFGAVSPTTAEAVDEELGIFLQNDDVIIDGGPCQVGIESTILNCTGTRPRILRPGVITYAGTVMEAGNENNSKANQQIRTSGMLLSHYSPRATVTLDTDPISGEGMIALINHPTPPGVIRLAAPVNEKEFAECLYNALRKGDHLNLAKIVVYQPHHQGIGIAIRDRLAKIAYKADL